MRPARIFLLLAFSTVALSAQGATSFVLQEKPGPHAVGFKVVEQYDYSRTFRGSIDVLGNPYRGERARPVQTLIWYPAQHSAARPVTVGDYFELGKTEASFGKPQRATVFVERFFAGTEFAQSTWAVRDAPLAAGRFPVVIYAPSFSAAAFENFDLCEYLASHGYVVIASPGMGVNRESTHDVVGIDAQARDISFLIGYAQTLPDADISHIAVAGFSWGGLSGLFAAARDNRIDALVALDGSMRYWPGLVAKAGDVHPEQMTLPLLFFSSQASIEDQNGMEAGYPDARGASVLNAWTHGDFVGVRMLGMVHPQFNSLTQRSEWYFENEFPKVQLADYSRADGTVGYAWVARYTREFLDAYLEHDATSLEFLKNTPAQNGVSPHVMGVTFRGAQPLPPSLSDFMVAVGRVGFNHADEVYAGMQTAHPGFKLEAAAVSAWGHELLASGHLVDAVDIMRLAVQLDPSSSAYMGLAEAYLKSDQKQLSIDNYKKALKIDPDNIFAHQILQELGSNSSK